MSQLPEALMHVRTLIASLATPLPAIAANDSHDPTWWDKFQILAHEGPDSFRAAATSGSTPANVDVSNECGPQSETFIVINPRNPKQLAAGSNEIFRLPMRAYFSRDGGKTWGGSDLPLPPPIGTNGIDFGSDPGPALDSSNNLSYPSSLVFFRAANCAPLTGTETAVAAS